LPRRRALLAGGLSAAVLGACGQQGAAPTAPPPQGARFRWKMITTWPRDLPGVGSGAQRLADTIRAMSGGRLDIRLYGAGELVPAFEVFDSVSAGIAEMGHGAAYYWKGKIPASQFFGSVPFGMTVAETASWLYHGGGLALWDRIYAPHGVGAFPAGSTGVQMGGWYNRPIDSVADLQGLKIRIPGLGGEVMRRLGANVVNLPGAEIYTALSTGVIDATEWIGPWNDLTFGLHQAARYYYYPGWQEPGGTLELLVNAEAWQTLPGELQAIVRHACQAITLDLHAEYLVRNAQALRSLVDEHAVDLRPFPDDVLAALKQAATEVLTEIADIDADTRAVHDAYMAHLASVRGWTARSEGMFLRHR
jgi:TRAP-type mannitol/chloroaromatic compound transport system substrate-binding protein